MKSMRTWTKRLSLERLSLQQRLPILICILLLTVMIIFTFVSYYSVRSVTLKSGKERLQAISDQLTNMFGQSAQNLVFTYRAFSSQDEVKSFLRTRDEELKPRVLASMQKLSSDTLTVLTELVDANYNPILFNTRVNIEKLVNIDSLRTVALSQDTLHVGNFYELRGFLYYPVKFTIRDFQGISGYILSWRKVSTSQATINRFSVLLGSNARLYVGNRDRSLWTNFMKPVEEPVSENLQMTPAPILYRNPKGETMLASLRNVPNTSWIFLVEFPRHHVLAPADQFLKWMIIIGAILNLIAIFVTWYMSQNLTHPLKQLTLASTSIASGNFKTAVATHRHDEIGKLARAFNAMVSKVSRSQKDLEQKISETENMTNRLRQLSAHLQNVREEERIHIAREMHDELGQLLTGFKMDVSWLHKRLGETTDPVIREKLQEMMEIINEAARFVRKLSSELRPSILDDLGLIPALDWHSQEFRRRSNINVEFRTDLSELDVPKETATGLFRMYQESLTNVARHADARKVIAQLELKNGFIELTITDDGKGFDTKSGERKTLGILGMKERASMLGGNFRIYSAPGKGTTVVINVPLFQPVPFESQ